MNHTRRDITLGAFPCGILRFRLDSKSAWVSDFFSSISMALWVRMPESGSPGVGREVTHQVLYLSSFLFTNPVRRTPSTRITPALIHPSIFPVISSFSCLVWAMCPQLWPSEKYLNFWNWLCCPERCSLTVCQRSKGCVEGVLWWNAWVYIKTSSEAVALKLCWFFSWFQFLLLPPFSRSFHVWKYAKQIDKWNIFLSNLSFCRISLYMCADDTNFYSNILSWLVHFFMESFLFAEPFHI